ncbi:MAG: NAD(P)/FAD-dependent oxidoreductase [Acidobacteriota bacterium]
MTQRAVVIGGGAIGIASAYYLTRSGWQVMVVDRGEIGRGCSYGNSCLISPSHAYPLPGPGVLGQAFRWMLRKDSPFYVRPRLDPGLLRWAWRFRRFCNSDDEEKGHRALLRLSQASLELFEELLRTREADFFYQRRGLLNVYLSEAGLGAAGQEKRLLEQGGLSARLLSREEAMELEPALAPRIVGGLFTEGDAHGLSFGYVQSMAAAVERHGGSLRTHCPVSRVLVERNRVKGIELASPREEIPADLVVLAGGAWSSTLAEALGIPVPLQPAKGYSCTIDHYPGAPAVPILIQEKRVIVTPLGGRIRFGGTLELAGYDLELDSTRYGAVVRAAREVLKDAPPMKNEEPWCSFRPLTPDGLPIIDRARRPEGLIVATGHAMLGFTQSPMTGKLVAELANDQVPSLPLTPFHLERFRRSR